MSRIDTPYTHMYGNCEGNILVGDLTTGYSFVDPAKLEAEKLKGEKMKKDTINERYDCLTPEERKYMRNDQEALIATYKILLDPKRSLSDLIVNVVFNDPATIVFWKDGTKTVVKAEGEPFDPEKGMAMACAKKLGFNKGNYFEAFKEWLPVKGVGIKEPVQLLSAKQLAEKIGCSPKRIAKECREGQHPGAKKINGVWRIPFTGFAKDRK